MTDFDVTPAGETERLKRRCERLERALKEIAQFSTHTDRDELTWIGADALDIARAALDEKETG